MIIAVDYDGTLERDGVVNTALIRRLKAAQRRGDYLILWTCREGDSLRTAAATLAAHGLRMNAINRNAPWMRETRKVFADVYIDDKAAGI